MSTELLIYTTRRLKQFRVQQLTMENHILAIPETGTITFNDGSGDVTVNPYEAVFFEKGKHYFSSDFDEHTEVGKTISTKKAAGY